MSTVSSHPSKIFHYLRFPITQLEKRRKEFRKYLESQGAIDNLTSALVKLYETNNKPADAVKFIRKHMCESCPDDEEYEVMAADLVQANKKICELERELSRIKGNVRRTASEVDLALEKGFDELKVMETKSLLGKLLTKDVIKELKLLKTKFKGNLLDCVQAGVEILDSPIGAFACDAEAYSVFASLFDPLIEELHGFKKDDKQPAIEWGEPCKLPELDEKGDKIISIRMRCSRSVDSFPFAPIMSAEQYEEIMSKLQNVTKHLSGDLMGKFHALEGMDETLKKALIDDSIMFGQSRVLKAANGTRFWPTGRGIFVNEAKTFVIWCNEEDHLRLISMESSGNLSKKKPAFHPKVLLNFLSLYRKCLRTFDERRHSSFKGHRFRAQRTPRILDIFAGKLGKHNRRVCSIETR